MTEATGSGVSLKPSDAQAGGGGLFDDLDVRIKSLRFCTWDYKGKIPQPVLGLEVIFERLSGDEAGTTFDQTYSAGDLKFLVPSPDGSEAVPVTQDRTGITEGTNALQFLLSIVNAGFPEHLISNKVPVFAGIQAHVNRVPQQKRPGIKTTNTDPNKKDDILVVTKILNLAEIQAGTYQQATAAPAKAAAGKGKTQAPKAAAPAPAVNQAAPAPAAAAGAVDADAVTNRAVEIVMQLLTEKGGSIPKASIAGDAFKILNAAKDPLRNQVSQLVYKDDFLAGGHGPWQFDGTTVSLG